MEEKPISQTELEDLKLEELKEIAIGFGFDEDSAESFRTKEPLVATIKMLQRQKSRLDLMENKVGRYATQPKTIDKATREEDRQRFRDKQESVKEMLAEQEKVTILVPLEQGEERGQAVHPVLINGYNYNVKKGVYTEVPKDIADLIRDYQHATDQAGADKRLDREETKDGVGIQDALG